MLIGAHQTHPAADAFPLMDDDSLKSLAEDIKANGLRRRIVLIGPTDEERILDGRNRYLACLLAKVEPEFEYYEGDPDNADEIAMYVVSHNLARRNLTFEQRALCARRLLKLVRVRKARERLQPLLPHVPEAANHAIDTVMSDGTDELREAIETGEIDLSIAHELAKLEPEQQRAMLAKMREPDKHKSKPTVQVCATERIELSEADLAAWKAAVHYCEGSVHGVVRAGAAVMRKVVRGV